MIVLLKFRRIRRTAAGFGFIAAIFAIVNLHHYFRDHVIWRRDNPDTRYLRS